MKSILGVILLLSLKRAYAFQALANRAHNPSTRIRCQDFSLSISSSSTTSTSTPQDFESELQQTPLSMTIDELKDRLGGKGRAIASFDCFRIGVDPLQYFNPDFNETFLDSLGDIEIPSHSSRKDISTYIPTKRQAQGMGMKALAILSDQYPSTLGISESLAQIMNIQTSKDGTTKLLIKLKSKLDSEEALLVETVIIPWSERNKSTLCVSSQVGCRQGCTFCATGRMGKLYDLSADEILIQLYFANKICRIKSIPTIDNIVFMGMGEPTDNQKAVSKAVEVMVDKQCFALAPSKITISTIAPTPDVFENLAALPVTLAWSVHAVRDDLRKQLVPTTRYKMEELKSALINALLKRNKRMRATMLEITLIDGLNDGVKEAEELAEFALDMMERVPGIKVIVNLIPFNDIGHATYRQSSEDAIRNFQRVLTSKKVLTYTRTTRGDDESAACGQLATKKRKEKP